MKFKNLGITGLLCAVIGLRGADQSVLIKVTNGTATFDAETNHKSVSIKGKSTKMVGEVNVTGTNAGLHLSKISARVPAKTFATGMALRNAHLIKYIFTTEDGSTPDLTFTSGETECAASGPCVVEGMFAIRDKPKPLTLALKIVYDGAGFKVSGDGKIKLSDYMITPPEEFGVIMKDEVLFHLEFYGGDK